MEARTTDSQHLAGGLRITKAGLSN